MKRFFVGCCCAWSSLAVGLALGQVPTLTNTAPYAVPPGTATEVRFVGDNLNDATGVWSNLPGLKAEPVVEKAPAPKPDAAKPDAAKAAAPAANPKQAKFKLSVPADAVPGVYGIRVLTSHGASNLRLIMVDDLATVADAGGNKTAETAQALKLPIAIDGATDSETSDFYKVTAQAGERFSVDVVARRLGTPLDPVVRLLDAAGREVAFADDDESTGVDGRFTFVAQQAGSYVIEVRDVRYSGNANYRYRLRVGDFPLLTTPYPMGVRQGTTSLVLPVGPQVGPLAPIAIATGPVVGGQLPIAASYAAGKGSGLAVLAVGAAAEQAEFEPNDKAESASPASAEGAINGRFDAPGDRDYYRFEAKKGTRLRFVGRTRGYGSPTDLLLRLTDTAGKTIVEAEDAGLEEGALDHTFAADGPFLLAVEELLGRGGPQYTYRVEIEPYSPGFALTVDAEKLDLPQGGVAKAKVTAVRRDFTGLITFRAELDGGMSGVSVVGSIPEGKNDGAITFRATPDAAIGTFSHLRLIGEGKLDKEGKTTVLATALTTTALKPLFGGLTNPPAALTQQVAFSIVPPVAAFIEFDAPPKVVVLPQLLGKAMVSVKIKKLDKFDDVVDLKVEGLPAGFSAKPVKIEKGKAEATIEIVGPTTAAPIECRFQITATATHKDQPRTETLDGVVLRVGPAIETTVDVPASVQPGTKAKLTIRVVRHVADKTPLVFRARAVSPGLTLPAEIQIAADKNEATVELAVDAKTPLGPGFVALTASGTIGGRAVTLEAGIVGLTVSATPPAAPTAAAPAAEKKTAAK